MSVSRTWKEPYSILFFFVFEKFTYLDFCSFFCVFLTVLLGVLCFFQISKKLAFFLRFCGRFLGFVFFMVQHFSIFMVFFYFLAVLVFFFLYILKFWCFFFLFYGRFVFCHLFVSFSFFRFIFLYFYVVLLYIWRGGRCCDLVIKGDMG